MQYKVCPMCGYHNVPDADFCEGENCCGIELTSVPVTSDETLATDEASKRPRMVRICECGRSNPANARVCAWCGDDISDVQPTPEESAGLSKAKLVSEDGSFVFEVPVGECVLGRKNEMASYLADKTFVSRVHGRLSYAGGQLFFEDLDSTNGTCLNGKRILAKTRINSQDRLQLGHNPDVSSSNQAKAAYFIVQL